VADRVGLDGSDGLTARLCRAVGQDPNQIQGFRLTVLGGHFPKLEIITIPDYVEPNDQLSDPWSEPLTEVAATYTLYPKPDGDDRDVMMAEAISHLAEATGISAKEATRTVERATQFPSDVALACPNCRRFTDSNVCPACGTPVDRSGDL